MSRTETKDITLDLSEETLEINAKPQIKASRATRPIKEQSSEAVSYTHLTLPTT